MEIKLNAGKKYSICSCGLSNKMPFCDNAHREYNTKNNTDFKSVKIIPDKDVVVNLSSSRWNLDKGNE